MESVGAICLRAKTLATGLLSMGYAIPPSSQLCVGNCSADECLVHLGDLLTTMKPICRMSAKVYSMCGELVHLRLRLGEVDFPTYLEAIDLCDDVREEVTHHMARIVKYLTNFYSGLAYYKIKTLGLMSAMKYEDFYLTKFQNGTHESIGQFFTRIAATVATHIHRDMPQYGLLIPMMERSWFNYFDYFFNLLSHNIIIPPTPAMLFMGRKNRSLASCYLLDPPQKTTLEAMSAVAQDIIPILNHRGGIGINVNDYNQTPREGRKLGFLGLAKLIDTCVLLSNSDSERPTGVCMFMEPWNADVESFLGIKGLTTLEHHLRCDNIFNALWIPDLFMKRYMADPNTTWSLFDDRCNHLAKLYGKEFEDEYHRLETAGMAVRQMPIKELLFKIIRSAIMTGSPFIMFKDSCNRHYYMDTQGQAIRGSNLCTEIIHHTEPDSDGVCNLMNVNLPAFLTLSFNKETYCLSDDTLWQEHNKFCTPGGHRYFNFEKLTEAVTAATIFINVMIDRSVHPTTKTQNGAKNFRSMGIGFQGLNTLCWILGETLVTPKARKLGKTICEAMYLSAAEASNELCQLGLSPFKRFSESRYARGIMHFDAWDNVGSLTFQDRWSALRPKIIKYGLYNSQFIALMPTVSSSQITESSEAFYPVFTNLYSKLSVNGETVKPNVMLLRDLGSVFKGKDYTDALEKLERHKWVVGEAFPDLPTDHAIRKYLTAFEYDQNTLLELTADRAPFVDHSQSNTLYFLEGKTPISAKYIMNHLVTAYKLGLKTGMYYCRIKKATDASIFMCAGQEICSTCQ
ncbi:ribonucleotide reductase subunit 1 [Testudinid alphaherpesvirus 3]|uniref:Ribonucleoside-diphosphate reductase n=9 Tax=Herpesvirales TaxID=548681 RepID=A0A0K1R1Y7_9ALPH|nr:ribonucleotide reductase subunit 1 [Testudinid alphaherpesvirus 3]AAQ73541.2 ribonucleotide reductase large subunit [Tortoise herpesvirus]AIU39242.1 ribonucleotide reductase subunit 1 [Testudinid alphaherpesvirus 3]AIU39352.1 ribonucleotide reductase subunit 1 [Testudinid alphaherpesvirus 3]AKI81628.1 ribonucleotide reductase subunit 1 [Testudinid alphaherpesvirus 3]AKI81732.1 ribonucleotide reductase subunit 1 [Testudinid alphaherpesvirus 3]